MHEAAEDVVWEGFVDSVGILLHNAESDASDVIGKVIRRKGGGVDGIFITKKNETEEKFRYPLPSPFVAEMIRVHLDKNLYRKDSMNGARIIQEFVSSFRVAEMMSLFNISQIG